MYEFKCTFPTDLTNKTNLSAYFLKCLLIRAHLHLRERPNDINVKSNRPLLTFDTRKLFCQQFYCLMERKCSIHLSVRCHSTLRKFCIMLHVKNRHPFLLSKANQKSTATADEQLLQEKKLDFANFCELFSLVSSSLDIFRATLAFFATQH